MKIYWQDVRRAFDDSFGDFNYDTDLVNEAELRGQLKKFSNKVDELINRVNEPEPELEEPREIDPDFGHYASNK